MHTGMTITTHMDMDIITMFMATDTITPHTSTTPAVFSRAKPYSRLSRIF